MKLCQVLQMQCDGARPSLEVCFGEHEITLFDEFERHSVEVQLNRAILRRSFSAPSPARFALTTQLSTTVHSQRIVDIDKRKKAQRLCSVVKWWLRFQSAVRVWRSKRKGMNTVNKKQGEFSRSMRW